MRTPEQITQDAFDAYAENLTPDEREAFMLDAAGNWRSFIEDAIEADRAQRNIPFDTLDHMLNAWESYDGDVSGFIEAWADHFNEGTEVPDWAKA